MFCNLKNNMYLCIAKTIQDINTKGAIFIDTFAHLIGLHIHPINAFCVLSFGLGGQKRMICDPFFYALMSEAKTISKCVNNSNTPTALSGHESTANRDCKPMSIAEIITKYLPELAHKIQKS